MNTLGTQDFRFYQEQDIVAISEAVVGGLRGIGAAIERAIRTWARRVNERHALAQLDDHMLSDIDLTRADIDRECRKYFWQK